jgi:hypothetical protein
MTSQPDKFFRETLEHFTKPVSADAWKRVEAGVQKKHAVPWMKIAAGVALLSVAAVLLWPTYQSPTDQTSVALPNTPPKSSVNESSVIEPGPVATDESVAKPNNSTVNTIIPRVKPTSQLATVTNSSLAQDNIVSTEEINSQPTTDVLLAETPASKTIVYTAEEVNARFLKKDAVAEATFDEKNSSGIQKLIEAAHSLKNTDTGLGDLRQKKDEILALNFRDKKQGQN